MIRLFGYYPSGNSYKVELLFEHLELPYQFIHLDLLKGATHSKEFLRMNPNGRIPLVEVAPGRFLAESHAILYYYGERCDLMPRDRWERAKVLEWMCFEQYHVEPNIGSIRYHRTIMGKSEEDCPAESKERREKAIRALTIIEEHLQHNPFMVGDRFTMADLSLYAYCHVAEEADIPLEPFVNICDWLTRIASRPDHKAMTTLQDLQLQEH